MKDLTSWSYSRWDLHHTCPYKFKREVLDGAKEPPSPAMENGQRVHNALAKFLQSPTGEVPAKEAGKALPLLRQLTEFDNKVVEQQWGYNRQWGPTGWFAKANDQHGETWLRSVIDVAVLYDDNSCEVIDWKTGKPRGTHDEQMELFAVSVMVRFPIVNHVTTRLAYTDFAKEEFAEHPRADLDKMVQKWEDRVRPMFEDTAFLPRPGDACKFCSFSRSRTNGQDCRYG